MSYWYCSVKVKEANRAYSYISDMGELEIGSFVEVPFGSENTLKIGIVETCGEYDEENAPFPVDRTQHISRLTTAEEYEDNLPVSSYRDDDDDDWDNVERCIEEEDWDEVMDWASEHHDSYDAETLQRVIQCYRLCLEQNMPPAALNLGSLYYTGRGVEQDYEEAFRLYQIAADAGELRAICNLGYCYYYGRERSVDYEKAFYYFELGALLFNDANCLYKLGDMFLNGYHVDENKQYAFILYNRALNALSDADDDCLGDIQFRLGKCLLRGIGTARNVELSNAYLHTALLNFYKRRKIDPFVGGLIRAAKEYIEEAEALLDAEIL